jgi:hypothetical protein
VIQTAFLAIKKACQHEVRELLTLRDRDSGRTGTRSGFEQLPMTIVLREFSEASLIHEVMNALIRHSDRLVDEQFRYRGFARFSQNLDPSRLTQLSILTRTAGLPDEQFELVRTALNYETDTRRVPSLGAGMLVHRNRQALRREGELGGHMPAGFLQPDASQAETHRVSANAMEVQSGPSYSPRAG